MQTLIAFIYFSNEVGKRDTRKNIPVVITAHQSVFGNKLTTEVKDFYNKIFKLKGKNFLKHTSVD